MLIHVNQHQDTFSCLSGGVVSWRSEKRTLIATSTMEAEFVSCVKATSLGVWMKSFIYGLRIIDSISRPLKVFCDNSAAVFWLKTIKVEVEANTSK